MVFCFAPMTVFAQTIRENLERKEVVEEAKILQQQEEKEENYKTKKIIAEDIQKRTSNEKHYILEDGTKVATIYPSNVHYQENGEFLDIDNTLELKTDTKETLKINEELINKELEIVKNEEIVSRSKALKKRVLQNIEKGKETQIYENKSNSYKTKFTNKTREYNLGSITSQNSTLTWRLVNANSTDGQQVKNPTENKLKVGITVDELEVNHIASTIEYKDILDNVDISYWVGPEQIKETIVLNNKEAIQNSIVFEYTTGNLQMKLTKDNDIVVYQDKEENIKFVIKAPFMYDNKLEFSDKIEIKLEKQNEKYRLTLIPDKKWLEEEERAYPVTIDPTIQTSLYVEDINDTYIYKTDANNTTKHNAHILRVGNGSGSGNSTRSLLKFSLPTLNSGDQVIAAELSLRNYPDNSEWNPPKDERIFCAHRITTDWTSSEARWSNMSSKYDSQVIDYIKYKYDSSNPQKDNRFDITTLVKKWYTTGNNYGIMIKEKEEKAINTGSDAYFYSADTSGAYINYRPKIIIAYRNQTGIENYLSYHCQSVGRAGEVYTNDYNGNLTLVHTDAATPGNRLPVTVEHIYNTNNKDIDIGYGKGVRLSLSQIIEVQNISSQEYLKYIDEDATAHYFKKNSSTNLYEDEDGLGLTIKISGNNRIMTDKSGNTMTFIKYSSGEKWHLSEIKDTSGNTIKLTLTSNNNQYLVSQVTDAAGDKITLTYSSGRLQKITDMAGRVTTYTYDSSGRLTTITYPDNKSATYSYGSKNELTRVKDIDNSYLDYTYYPGSVYRVKSITEYGTDSAQGNSLTIEYGSNLTKMTDNNGYANTYTFDDYGHCISIADFGNEPENINNAYGISYNYGTSGNIANKLTLESKMVSVKELDNNLVKNSNFTEGLDNWIKHQNCTDDDETVGENGNAVFKMVGDPTKNKYLRQEINISGKKGDIYTLYGWLKTLGVPSIPGNTKSARLTIGITRTDNTVQWKSKVAVSGTEGWQFLSEQIITDADYKLIEVYLIFYGNANEIYFDNIGLFKEEFGVSYQYDSKGNIISTQDLAKQNSTFKYDGNNNLIQAVNPKGGKFIYEYDTTVKNRLLKATNNNGIKYSLGYDSYGNNTSVKIENPEKTSKYIESKATYTQDGNYVSKTQNQLEKETSYTYNKGLISSVVDPKGNTINYTYDNLDRLTNTKMTSNNKVYQNTYTYENDKLAAIEHNGTNYHFEYDAYGNTTKVKVGNQVLITKTYQPNNGKLETISYGNKTENYYVYDRFDRVLAESEFRYGYDGRGNLIRATKLDNTSVRFQYDLANRLVNTQDESNRAEESYTYDNNGNITEMSVYASLGRKGFGNATKYEHDVDNNVTKISNADYEVAYNYDGLQRLESKKVIGGENEYNIGYTYTDISDNKTTTQIKSIKNGNDETLNYTYDANGNIETISKGAELKQKYYYDGLGQLIRENDKEQNKTITYEYDTGGNILNKKEYSYTEGEELPEAINTISCTYGNTEWKDQLRVYDGKTISYDAIGNVRVHDGKVYNWRKGRQLVKVTNVKTKEVVEFEYNQDGIRTKKGNTQYTLRGDRVVIARESGDVLFYFSYDEIGQPIGITKASALNNTYEPYYYKKNIQGDIIGILDKDFKEVVKYTYDSWGKVLSITDENGEEITDEFNIGIENPFRYRGYWYDTETGLYYLQSRYYNPEWGRFISADNLINDFTGIFSTNLYAYCNNNPVNMSDFDGHFAEAAIIAGTYIGTGNFWNPFGWIVLGVVTTVVIGYGVYTVVNYYSQSASSGGASSSGTASSSQSSQSSTPSNPEPPNNNKNNRGTRNQKIKQAAKNGREMHKQKQYGTGTIKEFKLSNTARVDAISFQDRIIYELKPNNPWSIARGNKQLARYVDIATKKYGGVWQGKLILY